MEILLCYRQLFVKGDVFIGEWVHLVWLFSFIIADFLFKCNFVIGRVECIDVKLGVFYYS